MLDVKISTFLDKNGVEDEVVDREIDLKNIISAYKQKSVFSPLILLNHIHRNICLYDVWTCGHLVKGLTQDLRLYAQNKLDKSN